jgi:hypothetical protein
MTTVTMPCKAECQLHWFVESQLTTVRMGQATERKKKVREVLVGFSRMLWSCVGATPNVEVLAAIREFASVGATTDDDAVRVAEYIFPTASAAEQRNYAVATTRVMDDFRQYRNKLLATCDEAPMEADATPTEEAVLRLASASPDCCANLDFYRGAVRRRASLTDKGSTVAKLLDAMRSAKSDPAALRAVWSADVFGWFFPLRQTRLTPVDTHKHQPLMMHEVLWLRGDPAVEYRVETAYQFLAELLGFRVIDLKSGSIEPRAADAAAGGGKAAAVAELALPVDAIMQAVDFLRAVEMENFAVQLLVGLVEQGLMTAAAAVAAVPRGRHAFEQAALEAPEQNSTHAETLL